MNNHSVLKSIVPHLAGKEKDAACRERADLREKLKSARKALPPAKCRPWSMAAQKKLLAHELFEKSRSIALYMPIQGELGTELLLTGALDDGKTVYMPRTLKNRLMEFAPVKGFGDLESGNFGIPEPKKFITGFGPDNFAPELMLVPGWLLILRAIALALAADITTVFWARASTHGRCSAFVMAFRLSMPSRQCPGTAKWIVFLAKTAVMR